jgi:hypothetical protein
MTTNRVFLAAAAVTLVGCGGGSGGSPGGPASGGAGTSGRFVQYAVLNVMGDQASGLQPYVTASEVVYDEAKYYAPSNNLGLSDETYYPPTSKTGAPDTTDIVFMASAPAVQGSPDAGGALGAGGAVALKFTMKGKPTPGLEVKLGSPALLNVTFQVFDAKVWAAAYPLEGNEVAALTDFSFKVDAATMVTAVAAANELVKYVVDGEAHATTAPFTDKANAPGTVDVAITMSQSVGPSGVDAGVVLGTCAELTTCCDAIADAAPKATCKQLEKAYQGMVSFSYPQMQADRACATFLVLERKALLCP